MTCVIPHYALGLMHCCLTDPLGRGVYPPTTTGLSPHSHVRLSPLSATPTPVTNNFYRAMHFSAYARSWDRMSSVCPSVCPSVRLTVRLSVTLVDCDHISWKSWKLIARTISPTPSLFVAKRRSTYSQGNMGKFGGD